MGLLFTWKTRNVKKTGKNEKCKRLPGFQQIT